jgi:hypothetical protein
MSILVNIIQNYSWIDGLNYALNVSAYSNFGGIKKNGHKTQITNNINELLIELGFNIAMRGQCGLIITFLATFNFENIIILSPVISFASIFFKPIEDKPQQSI